VKADSATQRFVFSCASELNTIQRTSTLRRALTNVEDRASAADLDVVAIGAEANKTEGSAILNSKGSTGFYHPAAARPVAMRDLWG
jgi:hypothetical protein